MCDTRISASDVQVLRIPMSAGGLPYSLCYLVTDARAGVHVIDPGSPGDATVALIADALQSAGRGFEDVASILITHGHADHAGAAPALRAATGAPVLMHERERQRDQLAPAPGTGASSEAWLEEWGVPVDRREDLAPDVVRAASTVAPDAVFRDGDTLDIPGRTVRVLWTPGHTVGHACFDDETHGLLYTGDHVLPTINSGLGLGGPSADPLGDYLRSLRRIAALPRLAMPGHELPFSGLADRCAALADHQLRRTRQVQDALAREPGASVWEVAQQLTWTAGWSGLSGFTLRSALAQTAMHRDYLRAGGALRW